MFNVAKPYWNEYSGWSQHTSFKVYFDDVKLAEICEHKLLIAL